VASTSGAAEAHRRWRRAAPAAATQRVLGAAAAAALAIDAYVHFHDAGYYTAVTTSVLSQAALFRVQAALAAALALALLARPSRLLWTAGFLVAAGAFGAVLLYRYVDVGALGPMPNMYEPTWVSPGKLASAWAEGAATILTSIGLLAAVRARRHREPPHPITLEPVPLTAEVTHAQIAAASPIRPAPEPHARPPARPTHWLTHTASAEFRKDNHHD
jgi:hypothetical protein